MSKKVSNRVAIDAVDAKETGHRHVFTMECIDGFLFNLKGEILTIIDASVADTRQLKAIKDLVHNRFNGTRWDIINVAANELPDVYGQYGLTESNIIDVINQEQLS